MQINSLVGLASTADAASILVLKKGIDTQAGIAMQLLEALPPAPQPAHLGQSDNLLA